MRGMDGYMRGVNLGGWLSQFDAPTKEHFDTFIKEEDIRRIAGLGLDHVRVPVDYTVIETEDGVPKEEGYQYIDRCVQWCRNNSLHMIIDIHKTYGYSFDPLDKDDKTIFFTDQARQQRFWDMWEMIAKRYSSDLDIVAYELLNEIVMLERHRAESDRRDQEVRAADLDHLWRRSLQRGDRCSVARGYARSKGRVHIPLL